MPRRLPFSTVLFLILGAAGIANAAKIKAPTAPSNFKVTAVGVNAFKLKWKDNSDNEAGWEVLASLKGGKPQHYAYIPSPNVTSYTLFTNDLPGFGLVFQLAAYNGDAGKEVSSAPTAGVTVKAQSPNKFSPATELTAKTLDDGRIRLNWTDNSTSESGYQIDFKETKSKKWLVLGTVQPELKFDVIASGLAPKKNYSFRVRAFKGEGAAFTKYSNVSEAKTKVLRAPKSLVVTPDAEGSFKFKWKDRSKAETGYELQQQVGNGRFTSPGTFAANTSSTSAIKDFPLESEIKFRIRAYHTSGNKKVYSKFSNTFATRSTGLAKPDSFAVTGTTDTSIKVKWKDNSGRESGYLIEYRKLGATAFTRVSADANSSSHSITGLEPGEIYQMRVRAKEALSGKDSAVSPLIQGKTREGLVGEFTQPLVPGVGFFYQIVLSNTGSLTDLNVTGLPAGLVFNKTNRTISGTTNQESGFSVVVTAKFSDGSTSTRTLTLQNNTSPAKPADFVVTGTTDTSVSLAWTDNSAREKGYRIEYRKLGAPHFRAVSTGANAAAYTIDGLESGQDYEFQLSAAGTAAGSFSPYTDLVQSRTMEGIIGDIDPLLTLGTTFHYEIQLSDSANLTSLTVIGLPDGLTFDEPSATISGTVDHVGTFALTVTATFSDESTSVRTVNVRSIAPPVIDDAFDARNVGIASSVSVSVEGKFSDPDTASAAHFETTSGQFDMIFFPADAPLTVDNFMDYIDAGAYDDTFFHRVPRNFVVQGGGYKYTEADGFSEVTKFAPVVNEPGISNLRGTVAMAKIGGDPDSATCEWFVNVKDNSANLDVQNGGFTVFGRVPASGMTVIDQIRDLPVSDYQITANSTKRDLGDVPIDDVTAPAVLDPAKLVKIQSVGPAPILSYEVVSLDPDIATAVLAGSDITITGVSTGSTTLQVTATDLDGNSVSQDIAVTVP